MKVFILSIILTLSACAHKNDFIKVDYKPITPSLPKKPSLPIKSLNNLSKPDQVIKAYVATVFIQKSYIDEVNNMISSIY